MAKVSANTITCDFELGAGSQGIGHPTIVDIPRALSLINRKSYRSGMVYSVDYMEYIGNQNDQLFTFILPMTYPLMNAYKLVYEEWKQQRADSIGETGIEPGKWSDFKPWFNVHHFEGTWTEAFPIGLTITASGVPVYADLSNIGSEWNRAEIVFNDPNAVATSSSPPTTTYNVGMLGGDDAPAFYGSAMQVYGDTRPATLSLDPLLPVGASSSWITRTGAESAEMSTDVIDLIENENDFPPYANQADVSYAPIYNGGLESVDGGFLHDKIMVGSTGRAVQLNGGLIPLGLIAMWCKNMDQSSTGGILRVHCSRGEYKGVAALKMGDFS